ncbi:MAG: AAA family ATPase [Polyangiaceae bacterium]|nr:AAA family ATPase [Polyangiaceae bacterium]
MRKTRIKSVEVRGFRAFGASAQPLGFSSDVAVVWGPNSQGKTSLAEAFEFLFTGSIVRRDLLSSAKDEFAGTLRNVHLDEADEVFVEVELEHQGATHKVRRTLLSDYAKKGDCETKLEVDGQPSDESAFERIGVRLSQPPLAAPVLMQHTLPYVFSAGPKERSAYFKALLDVDDLDRFLEKVELHGMDLGAPTDAVLLALQSCAAREAMRAGLQPLLNERNRSLDVAAALSEAAVGLLEAAGLEVPNGTEARFLAVKNALHTRQNETFPLADLGIRELHPWTLKNVGLGAATKTLEDQRAKVEAEVERLIPLFEAALKVDIVSAADGPQPCPLCDNGTLSLERLAAIRTKLRETQEFRTAEVAARSALTALSGTIKEAKDSVDRILPTFVTASSQQRKRRGFSVSRARRLAGSGGGGDVTRWMAATRDLLRSRRNLQKQAEKVTSTLARLSGNIQSLDTTAYENLRQLVEEVVEIRARVVQAAEQYKAAEAALMAVLPSAVAKESKTEGWQELLDLRAKEASLAAVLREWEARIRVERELERAVKELKTGMGEVLDEKISAISDDVERWWNRLRPGEPTFFSAVKRRTKATRTIDFKASISAHADRSHAETRDAVAVLSYSQLQCLGLSLFLARAVREGAGFIILDDPVLAGDEDHRPYFIHSVIPELLAGGVQVVVMTQDQAMLKDMANLFEHLDVDCFQVLRDPSTGTTVNKTSDGLDAILARIQPYLNNVHPEPRKTAAELVRDAAERFCKELLVKDRRSKGDGTALVSDYEKELLQALVAKVRPLLKPDEPGKLETIRVNMNPGKHDAPVPGAQDIKVAYGYLKRFKKDYL